MNDAKTASTYEAAGVSISRGDAVATHIASLSSSAVGPIGGFGGTTPLPVAGMRNPQLVSTTDGVGTKILVAAALNAYDTIGIDLVAMCVNDLAVCGAQPLQFLDYIACGRINQPVLESVLAGIVSGCEQADCTLAGGETAEMPDAYEPDGLDLAGFAVGVVDADDRLPKTERIQPGDVILGAASSGIHSNGLSLARRVLPQAEWTSLLVPTIIYVRLLRSLRPHLLAAAHVTGGGLAANVQRVLPAGTHPRFSWNWNVPEVFSRIASAGNVEQAEMRSVFNLGVGVALIVHPAEVDATLAAAADHPLFVIGEVATDG